VWRTFIERKCSDNVEAESALALLSGLLLSTLTGLLALLARLGVLIALLAALTRLLVLLARLGVLIALLAAPTGLLVLLSTLVRILGAHDFSL